MGVRAVVLLVVLVAGFLVGVVSGVEPERGQEGRWVQTIFDDDPRWDCRSMGDRVCGPDIYKREGV